jgi:serine/threonine-protein kinase
VAAKAQICLEGAPDFWTLREKMFAGQSMMDTQGALELASSGSVSRMQLDACLSSPETERKLLEDIKYAAQYHIQGTPLVVVNGREAPAYVPFLYALVLAKGDTSAPGFASLPAPRQMEEPEAQARPH